MFFCSKLPATLNTSLVFPESILYSVSILLKVSGLISLFLPISRLPLRKVKLDDLDDDDDDLKFDDLDDDKFGK